MIGYASRTGTRRNLAALREAGWRILVSAAGCLRSEGFPYALDNGAWTAHQKGLPFDVAAFVKACDLLGAGADWIIAPDVVGEAGPSLKLTAEWLPRLREQFPRSLILVAVQDGMTEDCVRAWLRSDVGIFLGGSTHWKIATMRRWGETAHRLGVYLHVGRVNTKRRILLAQEAGADSFDGTSVSRFAKSIDRLDSARRQHALFTVKSGVRA